MSYSDSWDSDFFDSSSRVFLTGGARLESLRIELPHSFSIVSGNTIFAYGTREKVMFSLSGKKVVIRSYRKFESGKKWHKRLETEIPFEEDSKLRVSRHKGRSTYSDGVVETLSIVLLNKKGEVTGQEVFIN